MLIKKAVVIVMQSIQGRKEKGMIDVPLHVSVPESLQERYSKLAENSGRTVYYYVKEALDRAINQLEYECALLKDVEDLKAGRLESYSLEEMERLLEP